MADKVSASRKTLCMYTAVITIRYFRTMMETDIERLRKIIQEAVDLSGRVRVLIREKDT